MRENETTHRILGAAIEVHRVLGPGLSEAAYEECLCCELRLRDIEFRRQVPLCVSYKGHNLDCGYRVDLLVEDRVIVELKSVEELRAIDTAQVLTYLQQSGKRVGLLLNFNGRILTKGVHRIVL
jgi:GxxExxY protein